jgi:small-conductance mechanosensitive channel
MEQLLPISMSLLEHFLQDVIPSFFRSILLVLLGIPIVYWLSRWTRDYLTKGFTPHLGMIAGKIIFYAGLMLIMVSVLGEFGFTLGHLLGAAGIIGIALGFASQTSVSNVISGLFLVAEKPFVIGDIISVSDVTGQILSIDTLSIKLRTFDNRFVRIPNETIVKSKVSNITHFPILRIDLDVGVAYKEDLERVREILLDVAHQHPLCLQEPEPMVIFTGYGNSSIDMFLAVWVAKTDWLTVRSELITMIKRSFDEKGVEIPFPHMSLYKGLASEPIQVQMVDKEVVKNQDSPVE